MSPEVINCLKNEMCIYWSHFDSKYKYFVGQDKLLVDEKLLTMFRLSSAIKSGEEKSDAFSSCYYKEGNLCINEFLSALYDVFKEWQSNNGIELKKRIYEHTNRGPDDWFPIALIEEKINDCSVDGDYLTVYRGCNQSEFDSNIFTQRQSWSSDIKTAQAFAFQYNSNSRSECVVIQAMINKSDVFWDRGGPESEMVLRLDFSPISATIVMTYQDHLNQE